VKTITKITPADYPDLLAAVDTGVTQRELADRYDCAPSLVARHVARARRARELNELTQARGPDLGVEQHSGSMRAILEARIRDPKTSGRDLASLTNALARLQEEKEPTGPSVLSLRLGTPILEPGPAGPDRRYRLMRRVPRYGCQHIAGSGYWLTAAEALSLIVCALARQFSLSPEDILGTTTPPQ
jgi:hypothetical protein